MHTDGKRLRRTSHCHIRDLEAWKMLKVDCNMRFQANRLGCLQYCAVAAISVMHQTPCLADRKTSTPEAG